MILVVVISPFASIIFAGISPTEKPCIELKGLIAIYYITLYCVVQTVLLPLVGVTCSATLPLEILTANEPVPEPKNAVAYVTKSTFVPSVTAVTVATLYLEPVASMPFTKNSIAAMPVVLNSAIV